VLRAGARDDGDRALAELCEAYWPPLYAFARRRGYDEHAAVDATQGFFLDLLSRGDIARADPARGRFRSFLLTSFRNFLANENDKRSAIKRGGGALTFSIDAEDAEGRCFDEPSAELSPEAVFERRWATTLLERVLAELEAEFTARGRGDRFAALRIYLDDPDPGRTYAEVARELECSEGAVKVTVHRMRQRFRELLLDAVRDTVDDPGDLEDELRALLAALGGKPGRFV